MNSTTKRMLGACMLSALMLSASSCGTTDSGSDTSAPTDTTTAVTETDTTATDTTVADLTETTAATTEAEPDIYNPAHLKLLYTQESVCDAPSLKAYTKFQNCASEGFIVPGLNQSIVPQGLDYWEERGWMLVSGYCSDSSKTGGKGAVLFAVDLRSGEMMGEYYLKNMDGTYYTGHAGGVAVTEKNVFISEGSKLYRIPLTTLIDAAQCGDVTFAEAISVPVRASFCNYSGGILWVGDFQYGSSYPTDEFRHMTNRAGGKYYAWTVGYALDETTENEFKPTVMVNGSYATPDYILSMTERIQGMTFLDESGYIVLSQSYGRTNSSTLFFYENPMQDTPHDYATVNGVSVPVWFLDAKLSYKIMPAIPMSEGIANVNGQLYVLFESGASKYRLDGGKQPTDRVYAVDISKY